MAKKRWIQKLEGTKLERFEPVKEVKELTIIDFVEGKGVQCDIFATIKAHYTGALCGDGTIFQSSHDAGRPLMFNLGEVIEGWREGMIGMCEGGKRRLIIPSGMAYGSSSPSKNIPPNSNLVFDIELLEVK